MVLQQISAKATKVFSSYITVFENAAFGHVAEVCEHYLWALDYATPYPASPSPPPFPGTSRYSKGLVWIKKTFLGALQLDFFSEKTVRYERARWKSFQILMNW